MHALYVIWWLEASHVSLAALATILAVGDLAVTALEIPTGWFADRCGHRTSLIVGSLLQIAGMLFAWGGRGIAGVLTSCLLIAAGDAFRSGADQALLHRSCTALGRESDFQRIEGRTRSAQLVALIAMVLAGGAIVEAWGFAAGWLIETALCTTGLLIACAMVETPPAGACLADQPPPRLRRSAGALAKAEARSSSSERRRGIVSAAASPGADSVQQPRSRSVRHLGSIVSLILPAAVLGSLASAGTFLARAGDEGTVYAITAIVAIVTVAEAAGSSAATFFTAGIRQQWLLATIGATLAFTAIVIPPTFGAAVVALCFLEGLAYPLRAAAIQRVAADNIRARAASLASACDKALATIALVAAGGRK